MMVMKNFVFPRMGGSGLPSHFASCPPPFGLLLYLRKATRQTALAVGVLGQLCKTTFAPKAERTAPKAERAADKAMCSA
jgi:hypothetical protein